MFGERCTISAPPRVLDRLPIKRSFLLSRRHEGLAPTAEAARCRLEALGSMDPVMNPATSHETQAALKATRADLKSWTVSRAVVMHRAARAGAMEKSHA